MNLAFSAALIILLILPGISFRVFYLKSDTLKSNIDTSIINEFSIILFLSLAFQVFGISIVDCFTRFSVEIEQIYFLIIGNEAVENFDFYLIQNSLSNFFYYLLLLTAFSSILGSICQRIVLKFNLDEKMSILKVSNDWDNILSGRGIQIEENKTVDCIQIDALTNSSNGDILYCGILKKYTLNSQNGIDKLFLTQVYRRRFSKDKDTNPPRTYENQSNITTTETPWTKKEDNLDIKELDDRYYNMPGNYFIIPYDQIKNLNITYIFLS